MKVGVLLYASECWTPRENEERKIEARYMTFLWSVAGYTLLDKKRNEDIRKKTGYFYINLRGYTKLLTNWKEYIERMEDYQIPKLLLNCKPTVRRNIVKAMKRRIQQ